MSNTSICPITIPTRKLIQMVQKKTMLWDRSCPDYRNKIVKDEAWVEICTALEPEFANLTAAEKEETISLVMKKWYNVRDSYRKSKKLKYGERSKPYVYTHMLRFLDQIYGSGRITSNNTKQEDTFDNSNEEDNSEHLENNSEHLENEVFIDFEEAEVEPPKRAKLDISKVRDDDDNIIAVLANLIHKEEDEDRAFFKSITPAVKALSNDSKMDFRIHVMNLIKNLAKKEKKGKAIKVETVDYSDSDG